MCFISTDVNPVETSLNLILIRLCASVKTKDFLNMEFAFKYGIWEFLKSHLTSGTQVWHATVLIFDIYKIS